MSECDRIWQKDAHSYLMPGVWRLTWIYDMGAANASSGRIIHGKPASAISGHPDVPCFLLLDDTLNELFLSAGLGSDRILTLSIQTRLLFTTGSKGLAKVTPEVFLSRPMHDSRFQGEEQWLQAEAFRGTGDVPAHSQSGRTVATIASLISARFQ